MRTAGANIRNQSTAPTAARPAAPARAAHPAIPTPARAALALAIALLASLLLSTAAAPAALATAGARLAPAQVADLTAASESTFLEAIPFEPADEGGPTQVECRFNVLEGGLFVEVSGTGTLAGNRAVDPGLAGALTIPPTITHNGKSYTVASIGSYAFGGAKSNSCTQLTSVKLPATLTAIGEYAFANCTGLTSIKLPDRLAAIGHHAYYSCTGLSEVRIPASVTSMGDYAFCQCNGLKSVTFEGDATVAGEYAFTGATTIQQVAFLGTALPYDTITKKGNHYFNSEAVDRPTYYYGISFYANREDKLFERNRIAFAVVSEHAKFKDINDELDKDGGLLEGEVPAYPQNTNLWRFDGVSQMAATPTDVTAAYPLFSAYRDLARGSVTMENVSYTGEALDPTEKYYIEHPQKPGTMLLVQPQRTMMVYDLNGTELDPDVDFTATYYRANGSGNWAVTDDLTSPGEIRVVLKGAGRYEGTTETTFAIEFNQGCTFVANIPKGDGSNSTVRCAFQLDSLTDDGGTVSVVPKAQTKREAYEKKPQRAVPTDTAGALAIPGSIKVLGHTLQVTAVLSDAFGTTGEGVACRSLTEITLPAGIASIGSAAFGNCSNLAKVVFKGDAYNTRFGSRAFYGCPLKQVVFFGKKPNDARYSMSSLFPAGPRYYYTLRFFGSKAAFEAGADPIGSITLRDDFVLARVPDKPTDSTYVYEGAVPDYPSYYIDDRGNPKRHWYAPAWFYAEADDNRTALMGPLEDSTYAYATQMQDAFAIDDAIITGIKDSYDYTGSPVVSADDITVCSGLGGSLVRGTDYEISFERQDDQGEWAETENLVAGGNLRVVVTGLGDYVTQTRPLNKPFKIVTHPSRVGTVFTYDVPLKGNANQITASCQFIVTSTGEGRSCSVHPRNSSIAAILQNTDGDLVIPEYVECLGVPYRVTAVEDNSFYNCRMLRTVELPDSVSEIGSYAFFSCVALQSARVPAAITNLADGVFSGCSSLRLVELPDGLQTIGMWTFNGCSALETVNLPE